MADNDREIFDRLRDIGEGVARIDERTKAIADNHANHEARIRDLERESDKHKGVLATVSSVGGLVGAGAMWLLKQFFGGGN